jgi:hypothetical protein
MLFRRTLWNRVCLRRALAVSIVSLALLPTSGLAQAGQNDDDGTRTPLTHR